MMYRADSPSREDLAPVLARSTSQEIRSYPIAHPVFIDATYVCTAPDIADQVLAAYQAMGWVRTDDAGYKAMQARKAMGLVLEAACAAEGAGDTALMEHLMELHRSGRV